MATVLSKDSLVLLPQSLQPACVITLYPFFVFARFYGVYPFGVA